MSYLLDTNIIAELRKRERGHPNVVRWAQSVSPNTLYTSVLVIGEIRRGIELKQRTDPAQAAALTLWLDRLRAGLGTRILPVDERVAETWGRLGIPNPIPVVDGLIAATALVYGFTVVTRNIANLKRTGVSVMDPFAFQP